MQFILASQSPRRRQLLAALGYPVKAVSVNVDEHVSPTLPTAEVAEHLALRKAKAFPVEQLKEGEVLVTADTVVVHGDTVLGKPADRAEAIRMLHLLSGTAHTVYTGVCLRSREQEVSFTEQTTVHFVTLSDEDIMHYVDTYRPYDKAGAYGIQEWIGMIGISHIEGCYYNVMGLPLSRLYLTLRNKFSSICTSPRSIS